MKKLFLLAAGIMVAMGVNAQVMPMQQQSMRIPNATQEFQKMVQMPARSIMANDVPEVAVKHVLTHKSTYDTLGWVHSYSYGVNYAGSDNLKWKGAEADLFPDSLVVADAWYYTDEETMHGDHANMHKIGFTFDPMTVAFDDEWTNPLFGSKEEMQDGNVTTMVYTHNNYCIDSVFVRFDYISGMEKDTALLGHDYTPDTVRLYICQYPAYQKGHPYRVQDYHLLHYTSTGVGLAVPAAEFIQDASVKGTATQMKSSTSSLRKYDYILDPYNDSTASALGHVGWKGRYVQLDEPFEVEAGSIVCMMVEYLPSFSYDLDDTLALTKYNNQAKEYISKTNYTSTFSVPVCNYMLDNVAQFDWLNDQGGGYNCRLMEDNDVRYDMKDESNIMKGYYANNYYAMPMITFHILVGDEELEVVDTTAIDTEFVSEANLLINTVYPNPVNDQINVSLSNDESAVAILYNLVGQEVRRTEISAQVSTIDVADLASGIYMLKVNQGNKSQTVKITKR